MKGTWQGGGTWQTGGGGPGGLVVVVVLVLLLIGSGAATTAIASAATLIRTVAIICGVIAFTVGAAALGFLAWQRRHDDRERHMIPRPVHHQLGQPERPAIEQAAPRELHQHWHFHGVDEDRVAEILRRNAQNN